MRAFSVTSIAQKFTFEKVFKMILPFSFYISAFSPIILRRFQKVFRAYNLYACVAVSPIRLIRPISSISPTMNVKFQISNVKSSPKPKCQMYKIESFSLLKLICN